MKIYMCGIGKIESAELNELLLNTVLEAKEKKENLEEKDFEKYLVNLHNCMRKCLGLPNEIFAIRTFENNTKAEFVFFDKEPDGKYYNGFLEEREDGFVPYIEVEE